jgi:hypothetical protein
MQLVLVPFGIAVQLSAPSPSVMPSICSVRPAGDLFISAKDLLFEATAEMSRAKYEDARRGFRWESVKPPSRHLFRSIPQENLPSAVL